MHFRPKTALREAIPIFIYRQTSRSMHRSEPAAGRGAGRQTQKRGCASRIPSCSSRPCKPGSVTVRRRYVPTVLVAALCHSSTTPVTRRLQQPTPRHRTSSPHLPVYMVLQPAGRTAGVHRCLRGGRLPRLFTLTCRACACRGGRSFSVTLPYPLGYQVD